MSARDPRTPWLARALALLVLAYALSPLDLIPDFIPLLGQLDDLLRVPAGLWVVLRLIPPAVLAEARRQAAARPARLARSAWRLTLYALAAWTLWRWWTARG